MEVPREKRIKSSTILIVIIVVAMLSIAGLVGYWAGYTSNSNRISDLQVQLSTIQEEIISLQTKTGIISQNQTDFLAEIDVLQVQLSLIDDQIKDLQSSDETNQRINNINTKISTLQNQVTTLQNQVTTLQGLINELRVAANVTYENVTVFLEDTSLPQLFEQVRDSVVVVQALVMQTDAYGRIVFASVQGSGFVNNFTGQTTILTCNHVIENAVNINVTFSNGNTYAASLMGSDPTTDVAVLTTNALQNEYKPLLIVSSSTLKVGDPVIVVGTPYGLEGSMSTGIVSALNRTITVDQTAVTNLIQTTAPLNPGNSGGPLINYQGHVIGMATAIIQESQGIGLAIPSETILLNIIEIMD